MLRLTEKKYREFASLDDIFNSKDELGLLNVQVRVTAPRPDDLRANRFEEINQFIDREGRRPISMSEDHTERLLNRRLEAIIGNTAEWPALRAYDRHNLLLAQPMEATAPTIAPNEVTSLDDIFDSDDGGLLDIADQSIFDLKHIPSVEREAPDEIAQRTPCADFWQFESIFQKLHEDLRSGSAQSIPFARESLIVKGEAFILQGVMCFIDAILEDDDDRDRFNPRLRLIFENGTESNMLLRSLARSLYKDENGRRVLQDSDYLVDAFNNITHKDKRSGVIYIVKSLSDNPALKQFPQLYKIGYTEHSAEERTKNAERDIAFLESPIQIVSSIECFNLNPHRFETLIHGFLSAQRLNMTLIGRNGKPYRPQEWFAVPLDTAREVIRRIVDGTIRHFRMDNTVGRIVKKNHALPDPISLRDI